MSINLSIKLATKQLIVSQGMGIYIPCRKKKNRNMSSRTHVWMGNCFFEDFLVFRKWNEINLICLHYCCLPIHFNNWSFILLVYDKNCVICALTHLRTEFFCSIYGKLKPSDFMTATIRHLLTVCIGSPSANFESTACDNKCSAKSWCIVKNSKKCTGRLSGIYGPHTWRQR